MKMRLGALLLVALISSGSALSAAHAQVGDIADLVTVTTDAESYQAGTAVTVNGAVRDLITGQEITLVLQAPNGNRIQVEQFAINEDRTYSRAIMLNPTLSPGVYTIVAQYGGVSSRAETTFEVTAGAIVDVPPVVPTWSVEGFDITYEIVGGSIDSITPDIEGKILRISITADEDGHLTITLPREVIDSVPGDEPDLGGQFIVLVDEEELVYQETDTTSTHRTLYIEFGAGSELIEVFGTRIIPEFGVIAVSVLAVSVLSIVAITARSRLAMAPRL